VDDTGSKSSTTPRPPASWSPASAVWGVLTVLLVVFVLVNVAVAIGADPDNRATDLALQASLAAGLIAVPFAFATRRVSLRDAAAQLGLRRFRVARGIGLMFAAYGVFFVFLVAYGLIVRPDPQETVEVIANETNVPALIALGVLVVGAAPISEELFFRGFFFGGLRGRLGFWGAALISAVLFGLVHLPSGVAQAPALAGFGIVLAWLYERTGSLGPPILMHMLQNAIAFSYTVSAG
jgi:membrane protease YdiL (CAAX protease family)